MKRIKINTLLKEGKPGEDAVIGGWVRTKRISKNVAFIAMNDGSTLRNIQVVVNPERVPFELLDDIHTGASLRVQGLVTVSPGAGQDIELEAVGIEVLGKA
ncbi:MAG: OB-fold nucleic acid binding domain-containing protein, partial [Bacteroidales bacterium]